MSFWAAGFSGILVFDRSEDDFGWVRDRSGRDRRCTIVGVKLRQRGSVETVDSWFLNIRNVSAT